MLVITRQTVDLSLSTSRISLNIRHLDSFPNSLNFSSKTRTTSLKIGFLACILNYIFSTLGH